MARPHTITANGNAQVSTTNPKFGTGSCILDGTGDYLSVLADADFNWSASNFCAECWVKFDNVNAVHAVIGGSADHTWGILYRLSGTNKIGFWASSNKTYWNINDGTDDGTFTDWANDTWYHLALTWDGTTYRLFVDGTLDSSETSSTGIYSETGFYAGIWGDLTSGTLTGKLDEIRLSKGTARYTSNFTPSSSALTNDADTVLLIHCDGTNGSTTFTDDTAPPVVRRRAAFMKFF